MTLNDAALIAQIVATTLVVPSIVYLALQVRQNTAQLRANAAHQYLETSKDLNLALIENKQTASVYRRGVEDFEALDADEKTQFAFYVGHYYQAFSNMYDLWTTGALPDSAWHTIRKHLISMMALPGPRHIWDSWARTALAEGFVAYVDGLGATREASYSLKHVLVGGDKAEAEKP